MGKGGTKFEGDSVSVRRKAAAHDTTRNLRKNLDKFLETGVHPEIERIRQEQANQLPALPDLDVHRPFVFLDIAVAGKPLGRLVIELFDDIVPVAANHFRNRCLPGSAEGLAGSSFHKLLPRYALHGGRSRSGGGERLPSDPKLRCVEGGCVAVALDGSDFVIVLARALDLDRSHQVVGRIHKGGELLPTLGDLRTTPDDSPAQRVTVSRAGPTNHLGVHEGLGEGGEGGAGAPPKDLGTRLAEASEAARSSVMEALSEGLRRKRKPGEQEEQQDAEEEGQGDAGASGVGAAAGAGAGAPAGAAASKDRAARAAKAATEASRNVKARMLDSMLLGDVGDDSDEGDEGDGSGGSSSGEEGGE